ncbi:MAG: hypothetical protein RIQ93_328 [Verrucomicrobiota bacterium]|jgi:hypothetical protein
MDVGSQAQLFVDKQVVHSTQGIAFNLHQARKHPLNPLVKADRPWEGWRVNVYGSVLYDEQEKIFKMWYVGNASEWFPNFATHYATSRDGLHWEKPLVGTVRTPGLARHNAVLDACQIASVTKDLADPDPARRYKMIEWSHAGGGRAKPVGGPHALVSPNGLNWTRIGAANLFRSNDVVTAYQDTRLKRFVAFPKFSTPVRGIVRRCFAVTSTEDLLNWPDPRLMLMPDVRDDAGTLGRIEHVRAALDMPDDPALMRTEFYGIGVYQGESTLVGFPWVFSINNSARFPTDRARNHEGPCEIQLAASRDLQSWERPFRAPVIALGAPGSWDSGFLTTASQAFRHGDEVWLYYGGGNYTHGNPVIYDEYRGNERGTKYTCSIGLATWPLDRFVSAHGGSEGAQLTTVPLHFTGRRLELNVNAGKGRAMVEVLDAAGKPIAGFERSDPIVTDSLRATVKWKGREELGQLAGRPLCLRFDLRNAGLFSFAFRA